MFRRVSKQRPVAATCRLPPDDMTRRRFVPVSPLSRLYRRGHAPVLFRSERSIHKRRADARNRARAHVAHTLPLPRRRKVAHFANDATSSRIVASKSCVVSATRLLVMQSSPKSTPKRGSLLSLYPLASAEFFPFIFERALQRGKGGRRRDCLSK